MATNDKKQQQQEAQKKETQKTLWFLAKNGNKKAQEQIRKGSK